MEVMPLAITLKMNTKVDRVNVIKTVASHNWTIEGILQDDIRMKYNDIVHAKIKAYIIHSSLADGKLIAVYQPEMNEITVIGESIESENKFKNKIGHILETKRLARLTEKNLQGYVNNLLSHSLWLTDAELSDLITDAKNQINLDLTYIT